MKMFLQQKGIYLSNTTIHKYMNQESNLYVVTMFIIIYPLMANIQMKPAKNATTVLLLLISIMGIYKQNKEIFVTFNSLYIFPVCFSANFSVNNLFSTIHQ